jgi:hypothetical protein
MIRVVSLRRLMQVGGRRMVLEGNQDRKVIGAEGGQTADRLEHELLADEDVVERPAKQPEASVEGVEHAAPDARIQQPAEAAKQATGVRPGDIVQVAGNDRRPAGGRHLASDQHQLGIARQRAVRLRRARRLRMQTEELDVVAGS